MRARELFKFFFAVAILIIGALLYWSSILQESDLKQTRQEMKDLRIEMATLSQKVARDLQNMQQASQFATQNRSPSLSDATYPNLLVEDPYYTELLPQKLGEHFKPQGILKKAMIHRPENLHPFNGYKEVSEMVSMCTAEAANLKTGCYETLIPNLALKIEARSREDHPDLKEYRIFLRDDVYWEPLNPAHFPESLSLSPHFLQRHLVTAHDVKFFYDAVMNPYLHEARAASLRTYFADIEELRVLNNTTLVVKWRPHNTYDFEGKPIQQIKYTSMSLTASLQPLPRFVYQYFADGQKIVDDDADPDTYRKNSVWAQNFSQHWAKNVIVSCGPYVFDGMTDEGI